MKFGTQAGTWKLNAQWGVGSGPGPEEFCDTAEGRVLVQMDDTVGNRKFRDFICELVGPLGHYKDVADDVRQGFDVDTAVGDQLDKIGSVVGLPRQGFSDTRYRVFLNIQIDLLLSARQDEANWTGTHNNILRICRTFVGSAAGTIVLTNIPPYSFQLTVPGLALSELNILVGFICLALYAGVLGSVVIVLASDSLWDSDAVGPIADGGIWGSASVAVVPSATWNLTVPIGTLNCA